MSTDPKFDELHKQMVEEGLKIRRSVVGDEPIDRALASCSTEFSRAGQEIVTEWCWGYAWTRPDLERRDRSLLNLGILMALNRTPELAAHVQCARRNGLSKLELEAIIHATIYCGVLAGFDAFMIAERVLNEMVEKGEMPRQLGAKSAKAYYQELERVLAKLSTDRPPERIGPGYKCPCMSGGWIGNMAARSNLLLQS